MIGLWDTTGNEVVKALAAERRSAGGVASGLALTLIAVVEEKKVREAEAAATIAAAAHPCRLLIVVRSDLDGRSRLDAEIVVGGRLGPAEAVVMRMYGRLALHAESVVIPLLAPDVPVVTWWHQEPPDMIANDFLGVVAERRITDSAQAPDPVAALRQRAVDYAPGDTDLTWTRITLWRTLVAGAFDTTDAQVTGARIVAPERDPTAWLMLGWLKSRLGIEPVLEHTDKAPRMHSVELQCANGECVRVTREEGTALFSRTGQEDRYMPLPRRPVGDELAEELRRLDADQIYAEALAAMAGTTGLEHRPAARVHVWKDPALAARAASTSDALAG
ncbi:glucose-6-phosphate dehydrogenase assembly protein OpcA [Actinoplanes teichomyceticus]|uniref:Glucose-6-phosphate dehydrogenase assembly protein OpcA n=1 Tax=Actinoplanes teichomyceticus TaxID=1867 RepID=A0A561WJI3_ACTTI|nr:glucose-6-phosphate dehydrogenase assembly protein OpcA [Actinoplanes teichomyceticus]TWG23980.1 glucose-6-phosphate dehydrogenase assembly protein OpcA [Actinoplanes teichomyceticus]GIF12022.1 glucose-6-phosphate dehydrogenase assembly protein OpcA [Actinoplanes teichomyceticus]